MAPRAVRNALPVGLCATALALAILLVLGVLGVIAILLVLGLVVVAILLVLVLVLVLVLGLGVFAILLVLLLYRVLSLKHCEPTFTTSYLLNVVTTDFARTNTGGCEAHINISDYIHTYANANPTPKHPSNKNRPIQGGAKHI